MVLLNDVRLRSLEDMVLLNDVRLRSLEDMILQNDVRLRSLEDMILQNDVRFRSLGDIQRNAGRSLGTSLHRVWGTRSLLLSEEGGEEPKDYDGADDGDEELTETAVACGADAEELENPAAYCRTYDTKDEVKDAAIAAIALDTAGDVASDDTENDYINPVHIDKC